MSDVIRNPIHDMLTAAIVDASDAANAVHEADQAIRATTETVTLKVADLDQILLTGAQLRDAVLDGDFESRGALASEIELPFRDLTELIENAS